MSILAWAFTVLSLIGVVLNIKRQRSCFYFWAVANVGWIVVNLYYGIYAQAALFAVFFGTSIWGIVAWRPIK